MLSVVAASRNDGHGAYLLERTQLFVDGLADQVKRFDRAVELILVDWNPPSDRPGLGDVIRSPRVDGFDLRFIAVPHSMHATISGSDRLPFFQMLAKNVGIRRARGDAVLATNVDILLSDELFLASTGPLVDRCVYRADRLDVGFDPESPSDPSAIRRSQPIRLNRKDGIHYPGRGRVHPHVRGLPDLARTFLTNPVWFLHRLTTASAMGGPPSWSRYRRAFVRVLVLPNLHLNGCGDFTLMSRSSWEMLRGYPEWETFSWNLDSLLLYQAAAAGFRFVDLDAPALHLEHAEGWSPESGSHLFARLERQGVPVLTDAGLADVALTLFRRRPRGRAGWRTNTDGWGMGSVRLEEGGLASAYAAQPVKG